MSLSELVTPVLLLKTQSLPEDQYQKLLDESKNYKPIFLPVLTHTFSSSSLIELGILFNHPEQFLSVYTKGIVLTSQRAVEGLDAALSQNGDPSLSAIKDIWSSYLDSNVARLQIYVVGPATQISVAALVDKHFPPHVVEILGAETGTGEALVKLILAQDTGTGTATKQKRILFPTGEKRRDTIPRVLSSNGWIVDEIPCYETVFRLEFEGELARTLKELREQDVTQIWMIVFSPQGCREMLQTCGWLANDMDKFMESPRKGLGRSSQAASVKDMRIGIMSIGPTTQKFLSDEFGFEVDFVVEKPSAEGVLQALEAARLMSKDT